MIVKRVNLCALDTGSLTLGYVGENDHTQIRINCASVFADYPAAVVSMTVKAPSGVVYPREVETDGQVVIWTITDSDTASAGNGQIQLTFTEDGTIVKTVIAVTTVRASLVGDNPPPDPITDWIDEAGEALAKLEGMTASATQLPAGEDPTAEVEVVDGHYNIALGIPGGDTESIIDDTAGVGDTTKVWSANKSATDLSELKSEIDRKAPCIYQDASGDIVSFTDGADGMPLKECMVSINPVQSGSGDPAPDNVRPITGWTGAQVYRMGKNFVSDSMFTNNRLINGSGNVNTSTVTKATLDYIPLFAESFVLSYSYTTLSHTNPCYVAYYDINKTCIRSVQYARDSSLIAFTAPPGTCYIRLGVDMLATNIQIEIGTAKTAYTPYIGQTYPISWQTAAGTVYGGTVDTVSGTLTVTHGYDNLGNLSWTKDTAETTEYGNYAYFYANPSATKARNYNFSCSQYEVVERNRLKLFNNQISVFNSNATGYLRFAIRDDRYAESTAEQFATAMDGVQVVYELLEPVVYNLTDLPTITTLPGYNALWSDTGAVAVTYPADTQTYVDGAIASATDPDGNVVTVTGSTPSITGESGKRYICGTVDSISITPPSTGIVDVVFSSGTTPTVLTVPSSVKFPTWFNSSSLNPSATYEINIADGTLGAVMEWK